MCKASEQGNKGSNITSFQVPKSTRSHITKK